MATWLKEAHPFFMVLQKVINLEGIMEINYARGLGIASNNQAEVYGFIQGLKNIDLKRVQSILFVGDSSTILKLMNKHHISTTNSLAWIISQIKIKVSHFKDIECFHIIWGLNGEVDAQAHLAVQLKEGICKKRVKWDISQSCKANFMSYINQLHLIF